MTSQIETFACSQTINRRLWGRLVDPSKDGMNFKVHAVPHVQMTKTSVCVRAKPAESEANSMRAALPTPSLSKYRLPVRMS
jgi:hypothetical protein